MLKVKVSVKEKQHVNSSTGTRFFLFFLPPVSIIIFWDEDNSKYKQGHVPHGKTAIIFFFFTIIYDLSDFIDSLFTPTKTNKQDIIIKRSLRLLVSCFCPIYTDTLTSSIWRFCCRIDFPSHQKYNFLRQKLCRSRAGMPVQHIIFGRTGPSWPCLIFCRSIHTFFFFFFFWVIVYFGE